MNTFTIHHQRIITAKTNCSSFSSSKLVTYLDHIGVDTVSLYDSYFILDKLIISDLTVNQCQIAIVWLKLAKLYPSQYSLFTWDYSTALYEFCKNECRCNNNDINFVLSSIISMYYIDDLMFCVTNTLNLLQCQFVASYVIDKTFYYDYHKFSDLCDDLANSDYVCCSDFSSEFNLLAYLLDNGWFVNGDKTYVYHP